MVNGEWMYVCVGAGGRWPVSDLGLRQFGRWGARALRMDPSPRRCAASFHSPRRGALKVVHSSRQRIHPLPFLTFLSPDSHISPSTLHPSHPAEIKPPIMVDIKTVEFKSFTDQKPGT